MQFPPLVMAEIKFNFENILKSQKILKLRNVYAYNAKTKTARKILLAPLSSCILQL